MNFDINQAQDLLCRHLCERIKIVPRNNDTLMLETPFEFPDGDQYHIYLKETKTGGIRLSDGGHTLMHLSYENDISDIRKGTRRRLLEQILGETGIQEDEGEFFLETSFDRLPESIFQLGQALTKIYDLTFINRIRVAATFYDDLWQQLIGILPEERFQKDYLNPKIDQSEDYPIDFYVQGKGNTPLYIFGIPSKDKARLTTIILERLVRFDPVFESILVFANQQEIPRRDLARLTNVGGEMVASLDAHDDLSRKILRRVA